MHLGKFTARSPARKSPQWGLEGRLVWTSSGRVNFAGSGGIARLEGGWGGASLERPESSLDARLAVAVEAVHGGCPSGKIVASPWGPGQFALLEGERTGAEMVGETQDFGQICPPADSQFVPPPPPPPSPAFQAGASSEAQEGGGPLGTGDGYLDFQYYFQPWGGFRWCLQVPVSKCPLGASGAVVSNEPGFSGKKPQKTGVLSPNQPFSKLAQPPLSPKTMEYIHGGATL